MHTGKNYSLKEFILWTRKDIYILIVIACIPTILYIVMDWTWLGIPWIPVALVGTAAAFIVGFRNTQTYSRLWEARQIWGGIVNSSRTWGVFVTAYIKERPDLHEELINRHIAWMAALRFQLRQKKEWESHYKSSFQEYKNHYPIEEWEYQLEEVLTPYLSVDEWENIKGKSNKATQLIALQSNHLRKIRKDGLINEFEQIELENVLSTLLEHQGKAERIKNFPYPRQFASINFFFIWLFVLIVPFGMLNEFAKLGEQYVWVVIPFSIIVSWVFVAMERVGQATENPFEGGANDVPITAMSRGIEIDLLEMLDKTELPEPTKSYNHILS